MPQIPVPSVAKAPTAASRSPVAVPAVASAAEKRAGRNRPMRLLLVLWALLLTNPGWLLSVAFHSVLVGVLAFFVVRAQRDSLGMGVEAAFSERLGEESFENVLGTGAVMVESAGGSTGEQAEILAQQAEHAAAAQAMRDHLAGMGAGSGAGLGEGEGAGRGPGLNAAFFGTQTEGRTFVYVIDMSGSMAGSRFNRARNEVVRSINKLKPEQSFYVFFFNDRTIALFEPHPPKDLVAATTDHKAHASRWIRSRSPRSTTDPTAAMLLALDFKPDVIFLLTDGEVGDPDDPLAPARLREIIREKNKSGTQIHTIAFENEEASRTLEAIANENNGTFRFER